VHQEMIGLRFRDRLFVRHGHRGTAYPVNVRRNQHFAALEVPIACSCWCNNYLQENFRGSFLTAARMNLACIGVRQTHRDSGSGFVFPMIRQPLECSGKNPGLIARGLLFFGGAIGGGPQWFRQLLEGYDCRIGFEGRLPQRKRDPYIGNCIEMGLSC
jgi:hypothetical protein